MRPKNQRNSLHDILEVVYIDPTTRTLFYTGADGRRPAKVPLIRKNGLAYALVGREMMQAKRALWAVMKRRMATSSIHVINGDEMDINVDNLTNDISRVKKVTIAGVDIDMGGKRG